MKTLTQLTAVPVEREFHDPHGMIHAVANEPVSGFIRRISFGPAGVVMQQHTTRLVIPLEELWQLAETHEPALAPRQS